MTLSYFLTLLAPLFLGSISLIHNTPEKGKFFSKDYTTVLKGLCCLIVIYVHVRPPHDNTLQDAIGSFAYVCVTIFFLISAYGMMLSVEKNKNYLKQFWRNRLLALLAPCVLVNIAAFGLNLLNSGEYQYSILWELNSYVAVLLQWCLWFYVVEFIRIKFFPHAIQLCDWILIAGVVVSSLYNYLFIDANVSNEAGWYFERMGLVWGIILYRYYDRILMWMDKNRWMKVTILVIVGTILGIAYLKFKMIYFWGAYLLKIILGLTLILLLFTATSNRKFGNKVSLWLGNISYEVYLSHHMMMAALICWLPVGVNSGVFILLTVLFTLAVSTVIHSISKPIVNYLRC